MIKDLDFINRSLLFAKLAEISYLDQKKVTKEAKKLGFDQVEYYDVDGAQSYRFQNNTDCVISCRGTQPTQWNDIKADLRALPVMSETVSRVHKGFKKEVDDLWPLVKEDIQSLIPENFNYTGKLDINITAPVGVNPKDLELALKNNLLIEQIISSIKNKQSNSYTQSTVV